MSIASNLNCFEAIQSITQFRGGARDDFKDVVIWQLIRTCDVDCVNHDRRRAVYDNSICSISSHILFFLEHIALPEKFYPHIVRLLLKHILTFSECRFFYGLAYNNENDYH